jgi:hypothetical protein
MIPFWRAKVPDDLKEIVDFVFALEHPVEADVLLSILLKAFSEMKRWLDTAATNPQSKTSYWMRWFGAAPTKSAFNKKDTAALSEKFRGIIAELENLLFQADETKRKENSKIESSSEVKGGASAGVATPVGGAKSEIELAGKDLAASEIQSEYTSKKIEALHRNIMRYQNLFKELTVLANGPAYLLLDDLYHLRLQDQPEVIDYFHRIAKGTNLWLKIGTIRHRSRWYVFGNPSMGMKLNDDADEIDLDVTLEKYDLTKRFLMKVLNQLARVTKVNLDNMLADGGKDRLVLASGGVARDFLTIFRRAIEVGTERVTRNDLARGSKIGSEDVNVAAGELGQFKEEEFSKDTGTAQERDRLYALFNSVLEFCIEKAEANCFLVEKDIPDDVIPTINELVDLKFLHRARSRVTVRDRVGRVYDAYMLDLSRYTGERAKRNLEIVKFWGPNAGGSLRRTSLIFLEE